ncbi:cellulose synthase subunit [Devosia sp. YR412]|uniref:cellulose biosynthesis cyclic di-GMP-binding regulatory protein BcsB n=1 Tax=Devosia sp. YR412 TaxID=1881030 RepID=UPI0008CCA8C4|nr:cellulose biosynthesis cyclic di-GMP-binding regulatory protein BcsB [Devosia sp. YR412]SEP68377.1 cellulose synthase subunit [Devosia sp. YR412]
MMRTRLLVAALLSTVVLPVVAQPAPFDMTPESDLRQAPPPASAPASTPMVPQPVLPTRSEHFLLPSSTVRLAGEESREAMVVYLTQAQADAPARLQLSYLNAVVVAPEVSHLDVTINGTPLRRTNISSSSAPSAIVIDVPSGLLRAGANRVEFSASQRHRTDCTVGSTYELWTELDSSAALLSFEGQNLGQVRQLADLAAVGVDASGKTTIRLITPDLAQPEATRVAVDLAQKLALALRVPNLNVERATELSEAAMPGVLDVVLGPVDQLPAELAQYTAQAGSASIAALVPLPTGANTLLVSGPTWAAVAEATPAILTAAPVSEDRPRIDLPYPVPTLFGGQTLSLADLGVPTTEFNGRRYTTLFQFELPPDFYANLYGEAELVLDAAYSADVQPGSEIDIFANGQIASATPLLRTDGGLLRDTIIRFPMTNLRAGRNELEVVVNLNAQSDEVCSPGWTGEAPTRFVFSSSTQFRMPDYARAASLPNLQGLTGSAWPYADDQQVPLVLGEGDAVATAAMTLLARAATSSGKVLPVTITAEASLRPDTNAIVVMPLPQMSQPTLERAGVARGAAANGSNDEGAVLNQFRAGGNPSNPFNGAANWLLGRVGLTVADLRVLPQRDAPYPLAPQGVVLTQTMQPEGGLWTVLTANDETSLLEGMQRLAVTEQWRQIGGRASALSASDADVTAVETVAPVLRQTQPFSIWNMRLVAANWFSGNILLFTAALGGAALLLMLATALVLGRVGRQK